MDTPKKFDKGLLVEDEPMAVVYLTNCVTDVLCEATEVIDSKDKTVEAIANEVRAKLAKNMLIIFDGDYENKTKSVIDILNIIGAELEAMGVHVCVNTANERLFDLVKSTYSTISAHKKGQNFMEVQNGISVSVPFKMPTEL